MSATLLSFARRRPGWDNEERALLARVERLVLGAGLQIEIDDGETEDGDPWRVFCSAATGDVIIHIARIDGVYLLDCPALPQPVTGRSLTDCAERFLADTRLVAPTALLGTRHAGAKRDDPGSTGAKLYVHPSALLAGVYLTLLLYVHMHIEKAAVAARLSDALSGDDAAEAEDVLDDAAVAEMAEAAIANMENAPQAVPETEGAATATGAVEEWAGFAPWLAKLAERVAEARPGSDGAAQTAAQTAAQGAMQGAVQGAGQPGAAGAQAGTGTLLQGLAQGQALAVLQSAALMATLSLVEDAEAMAVLAPEDGATPVDGRAAEDAAQAEAAEMRASQLFAEGQDRDGRGLHWTAHWATHWVEDWASDWAEDWTVDWSRMAALASEDGLQHLAALFGEDLAEGLAALDGLTRLAALPTAGDPTTLLASESAVRIEGVQGTDTDGLLDVASVAGAALWDDLWGVEGSGDTVADESDAGVEAVLRAPWDLAAEAAAGAAAGAEGIVAAAFDLLGVLFDQDFESAPRLALPDTTAIMAGLFDDRADTLEFSFGFPSATELAGLSGDGTVVALNDPSTAGGVLGQNEIGTTAPPTGEPAADDGRVGGWFVDLGNGPGGATEAERALFADLVSVLAPNGKREITRTGDVIHYKDTFNPDNADTAELLVLRLTHADMSHSILVTYASDLVTHASALADEVALFD
ncbi:MAG: hypothetical protein AAGE83_03035, partial [Pseudomonadota bacterium]